MSKSWKKCEEKSTIKYRKYGKREKMRKAVKRRQRMIMKAHTTVTTTRKIILQNDWNLGFASH